MLSALVALSLTPVAYGLSPGTSSTYFVRVSLDGFIPILGGKQGKGQVDLTVNVQGLAPDKTGDAQATTDLTDFHLRLNGAEFPVDLETAKTYFPRNTVAFTPQGHVDQNDAPIDPLPIRLPGLDRKRIPDITYLPIEFPATGIEEGKSWDFTKTFEGVNLKYTITPTHVDDSQIHMKVDLASHDEYFEDASHGIVASEKDASANVVVDLTGGGTATFDRKKNLIGTVAIKMTSESKTTDLQTKQVTPHTLSETLDVSLGKPLPASTLALSNSGSGPLELLRNKIEHSAPVQRAIVATQLMHPSGGNWRAALPFVRSAVNNIHVPSQSAVRGQLQNLSVLARQSAVRVPELFNVENVERVGSFLRGIPSVIGAHWSPNNVSADGLAEKIAQYVSPYDASAYQAAGVRRRNKQHKTNLPVRQVKARG